MTESSNKIDHALLPSSADPEPWPRGIFFTKYQC